LGIATPASLSWRVRIRRHDCKETKATTDCHGFARLDFLESAAAAPRFFGAFIAEYLSELAAWLPRCGSYYIVRGDELRVAIEKLVYGGEGLARTPADANGKGKTLFVPFVVPGETVESTIVESRPGFARAKLDKVVIPSVHRVVPECPYFGRCGGCQYQHIDYEEQLRYKADVLRETLRRTAKLELQQEIEIHPSPPWNYRNRTRVHLRHQAEFALGYFRYNSHEVLPVASCPISSPLINEAIAAVWKLGRSGAVDSSLHGLQFFANHDDTKLLVEAYGRAEEARVRPSRKGDAAEWFQPFAASLKQELAQVCGVALFHTSGPEDERQQRAPLTSAPGNSAWVAGQGYLQYHVVGHNYRVSAGSFFQTNRFLLDELVRIVTGGRKGRAALDLYAGAGLFTQALAQNFDRVVAVEASPYSFADLRVNIPQNVECMRTAVEAFLGGGSAANSQRQIRRSARDDKQRWTRSDASEKQIPRGLKPARDDKQEQGQTSFAGANKVEPDLIVLDPPRAGLGEAAAAALGHMSASHVTYVSCDPATLARDLRVLLESGFRVEQAHLIDMFPQTYHMETVLHLTR
jgi:23S rRNA (uracil1939-C5)-methyltransferase